MTPERHEHLLEGIGRMLERIAEAVERLSAPAPNASVPASPIAPPELGPPGGILDYCARCGAYIARGTNHVCSSSLGVACSDDTPFARMR